jgi:hypothetical protein
VRDLEKAKASQRRWAENNKDKRRIANRKYSATHKEKIREKDARRRREHPEACRASTDKYQKTYKGRFRGLKVQASQRGISCTLTLLEYLAVIENAMCKYCGEELPTLGSGLDRIDSKIGYVAGNVVPCCQLCNAMKGAQTEEEFYQRMAYLLSRRPK